MASGFVSDFNVTDASNTSFAGISQAENVMLPSNVNDDFRAKDGAFARWLNDLGSTATVGGTANAITVTLAQPFTAYGSSAGQIPNGAIIAVKPTAANTGAVTLVVNSLTSKAIRAEGDTALAGGELAANGSYLLKYDTAYNSAAGAWVLLNSSTGNLLPTQLSGAPVSAYENGIINGNFDLWDYATSQTSSGYGSDNRWLNEHTGSTCTHSRQTHTLGQTAVPGGPQYFSRSVVTSSAGASNFCVKEQRIEGVSIYSGQLITITLYGQVDSAKNIAVSINQNFGAGGSPSAVVSTPAGLKALTTSFGRADFVVTVPSISGKTLGTGGGDSLSVLVWFDAGSIFNAQASSLGQQSGTFDLSRISVRLGDRSKELDPFAPRMLAEERAIAERYCEFVGDGSTNGIVIPGQSASTSSSRHALRWRVQKRATPTITFSGSTDFVVISTAGNLATTALSASNQDTQGSLIIATTAASQVSGQSVILFPNSVAAKIKLEAEL